MRTKKPSVMRKIALPAALFFALLTGGCGTAQKKDGNSFFNQYSGSSPRATATATASPASGEKEEKKSKKSFPVKVYTAAKGLFTKDKTKVKGAAKIVTNPVKRFRLSAFISGSYSELRRDGDDLVSKVLSGGVSLGDYMDIGNTTAYAEASFFGEGTDYREDVDIDVRRYGGAGKAGMILKSIDFKFLVSGGYTKGDYEGEIGTASLEGTAQKGWITFKAKGKVLGEGSISDFDSDESDDDLIEDGKEKGLYLLGSVGFMEENLQDLVRGTAVAGELGVELRDVIKKGPFSWGNLEVPYFLRLALTAREEAYFYPHADDKRETYLGVYVKGGAKLSDYVWVFGKVGYDDEHKMYCEMGLNFKFGIKPRKDDD